MEFGARGQRERSTPSGSKGNFVGVPVRGFQPRLMILFPFGELGTVEPSGNLYFEMLSV